MKIRQRGFSKFELVLCILVIVVVVTVLYSRYMALVVDAERAAFRGVLGWLQAGVNVRMSLAVTSGDYRSLEALESSNPMELVSRVMNPPSNYLGELAGDAATQARAGHWYFDRDRRLLVYRLKYQSVADGFTLADDERLGFQLKVRYRPADNEKKRITGLQLESVGPQRWNR